MMRILFLTIFSCSPLAKTSISSEDNPNFPQNTTPYNVHDWIQQLHLQTCSLVAVGNKYFAIFVEDIKAIDNGTMESSEYFVGICDQSTLEEWRFCSSSLAKKRKYKCRFRLKRGVYQPRVHRRFCDIKIMLENKDCACETTMSGEKMLKVRGFPTCYIPDLKQSLCRYNVCGLSKCASLMKNDLYTVECDPGCFAGNPFCEGALYRTSRPPEIRSVWSKWSGRAVEQSTKTGKNSHRSVATCTNKYTGKPDLDCLGPGTGCCPDDINNCSCNVYEENGVLQVVRNIPVHENQLTFHRQSDRIPFRRKDSLKRNYRFLRDVEDDIEDDEDDDSDLAEDIVLEEDAEPVPVETTTLICEACDRGEINDEVDKDMAEERFKISRNNTLSNLRKSKGVVLDASTVVLISFLSNTILFT